MENISEIIKSIIIRLIDTDEIDLCKEKILNCEPQEILVISSIDKIKIVIELENYFNITIDDTFLSKLDSIAEYYDAVSSKLDLSNKIEVN